MINVFSTTQFPGWVFLEFSGRDRDIMYNIPMVAQPMFFNTRPYGTCVCLKNWRDGWITGRPAFAEEDVRVLDACPDWVVTSQDTWMAHVTRNPKTKFQPKDPTKGMEKNFWPTIRALSGLKDEMVKKILCR